MTRLHALAIGRRPWDVSRALVLTLCLGGCGGSAETTSSSGRTPVARKVVIQHSSVYPALAGAFRDLFPREEWPRGVSLSATLVAETGQTVTADVPYGDGKRSALVSTYKLKVEQLLRDGGMQLEGPIYDVVNDGHLQGFRLSYVGQEVRGWVEVKGSAVPREKKGRHRIQVVIEEESVPSVGGE
jgi:hypothetical protein